MASGEGQLRALEAGDGDPRSRVEERTPEPPGVTATGGFFRETPLMMKSGRFIRWVMPEPGPKVVKTEDAAQDSDSRCMEALG